MHWRFLPILLALYAAASTTDDLRNATRKIDDIKFDRIRAGAGVTLTVAELNAWVTTQLPDGVRQAQLRVDSPGVATGTAMVDLARVARAKGFDPGWLLSKLLAGERPVRVTARIQSGRGTATVNVQKVEVGSLDIDGKTLEMLIQYVLLPVYPNATVGQPFPLGHNIDRLDVEPAAVRVVVGPTR